MRVQGTNETEYKKWRNSLKSGQFNGAYFYAKEIEDIILPKLEGDFFINTVAVQLYEPKQIPDGAIVVAHDNYHTVERYSPYFGKNITWICSKYDAYFKLMGRGERAVLVPMSVDTEYVRKVAGKPRKTLDTGFFGNAWDFKESEMTKLYTQGVELISNLTREEALKRMAKFKTMYAEGRCAIEATVLGCDVKLIEYPDFPAEPVQVLDSRDVIDLWQVAVKGGHEPQRIRMKCSVYPYCIGDTPLLSSEQLKRISVKAFKRGIKDPYELVQAPYKHKHVS